MKVSTSLEVNLFKLITYYHVIYLFLGIISPGLDNKLALLMLGIIYIYYNKEIALKKPILFVSVNLSFVLYTLYSAYEYHLSQITHSDYYSFCLLIFVLLTFSDSEVRKRYMMFISKNKKNYLISVFVYLGLVLLSIFICNGLKAGAGSFVPVLYGPYSVPHILAYSFVGVYCGLGLVDKSEYKTIILILKIICAVCVVWTAARSGVIALVIVIANDYLTMKNRGRKVLIIVLGICIALYLFLCTDLLINNPLIQKTIYAFNEGSITNGRERFMRIAMDYYNHSTLFREKLLGMGMNNLRAVFRHNPTVNIDIHAHNDYVNAICGFGVFGFLVLLVCQLKSILICKKIWGKIFLAFFLFVLSYYNGLAMYTVLTPILLIVFCLFESTNSEE